MSDLDPAREAARLDRLRALTPLPEGPLPAALAAALAAGAASVGYAVEPAGRALGVVVTGTGPDFGEALAAQVEALLDRRAAAIVRGLAAVGGHRALRLELVLGQPAWLRVGVRGITPAQAEVVLRTEGHGAQVARMLHVEGRTGRLEGLDLAANEAGAVALVAAHRLAPDALDPAEVDARRVALSRASDPTWPDERRRGGGLSGRALFDWLDRHGGLRAGAGERLGAVQAELEAAEPTELRWTDQDPAGSRVLLYRAPAPTFGAEGGQSDPSARRTAGATPRPEPEA